MSECFEFSASMTGSTDSGPLQPPNDLSPLPPRFPRHSENDGGHCHQARRKMTPVTLAGQPMQLTPLWEHVVRTQKFPTEVDVRSIFMEISGRLRDPEWEVRQHALRVLVDVLPTLDVDVMDKVMQPVVPELINNLGHSAPAVRKGALDTLRVYIVNSRDRDGTVQRLIHDGLNRCGGHDVFQTNVTTGVILSAPSLLFPSSNSPRPSASIVREVTVALASRLVQVTHQEAVVKSLLKIREAVGADEFDAYLREYDENVQNHFQVLSEVYDVKSRTKSPKKRSTDRRKKEKFDSDARRNSQRDWDSDSDTSGIVEEEDEGGVMPPARVVLETEIKFNEETAITMTILEEKDDESEEDEEEEEDVESGIDHKNNAEMVDAADDPLNDRRRTPRRVHFGGEIVKLRTPDSDETESVDVTAKTRIPLPISPATKMPPKRLRRRSSSQPEMGKNTSSPILMEHRARRKSRSVSGSPRKERYVHNADISPKKGILSRSSSPIFVIKPLDGQRNTKKRRNSAEQHDNVDTSKNQRKISETAANTREKNMIEVSEIQPAEIEARNVKEESRFVQSALNNLQSSGDIVLAEPEVNNSSSADEELAREGKKTSEITSGRNFSKRSSRSEEKLAQGQSANAQEVNSVGGESIGSVSESLKNVSEDVKTSANAIEDKNDRKKAGGSRINSSRGSVDIDANKCDSIFGSLVDDNVAERNFGEQIEDTKMDQRRNSEAKVITLQADEANSLLQKTLVFPIENLQEESHHEKGTEENFTQCSGTEISSADQKSSGRNLKNSVPNADSPSIQMENVTCSSSESEGKPQEPSWEELGLVGPEVLEDLHNKDDWRARVRGLERVASALRTPSALVAIEPRLGSLLHSVLGGERSCRVAAAGLAVAKVVIAGVSEEALKRRLPQLAWGLTRQGGPNAAQLARIAMLRLKPALLLEQLLQPHCLGARNAKMRENALQLLIFSLVTFPSTEFVMDTVAFKVAAMVGDRRRRVRQAALDTMAVLAQVYDSEDVLEAGQRAAKGRHDGESMIAAIRARLARKSLPLVSADGLVVYGLQISPTVQIVTGPDVDWIVAGSGSVSPGTGRTRGQIIAATTNPQNDKQARNDNGNLWTNKSNLVALGVGLHPKNEQPIAWQFVPRQNQDDFHSRDDLHGTLHSNGTFHNAENPDVNLKSDDQPSRFYNSPKRTYKFVENSTETIENDVEGNRTNFKPNDSYLPNNVSYKTESRIPVLNSRGTNTKLIGQNRDKPTSLESINAAFRKGTKDVIDSNSNKLPREDNVGFRNMYQRRKQLQQQNNLHPVMLNQMTNQPSDLIYSGYRTLSYTKLIDHDHTNTDAREQRNQIFAKFQSQPYQRLTDNDRFSRSSDGRIKNPRPYSIDSRQQLFSKNAQPALPVYDTYSAFYNQQRQNGPVYRALQTAPGPLARAYEEYQHSNRRNFERNAYVRTRFDRGTRDAACQKVVQVQQISTDSQTNDYSSSEEQVENAFRRRLRSLSPSQLYHPEQFSRLTSNKSQATSMYDIDKISATQEFNERNKHHLSSQTDVDEIQLPNRDQSRIQGENVVPKSNSSASSDASTITEPRGSVHMILDQHESSNSNSNSRSSSPPSQNGDKAFDVITTNASPRGIIMTASNDPLGTSNDIPGSAKVSIGEVMSKEWSSEDETRVENIIERASDRVDFVRNDENGNDTDDTFTIVPESAANRRRNSIVSINSQAERSKTPNEHLPPNYSDKPFEHASDTSDERILSTVLLNENLSFRQLDDKEEHQQPEVVDSNESNEAAESETKENSTHNTSSVNTESSVNESLDDKSPSKDVAFSTIPPHPSMTPVMQTEQTRRLPSRVPRRTVRHRSNSNKMQKPDKSIERTKPVVQQCFAQLESKDWEVAMKGLKALSQIAKQHPEYLDLCAAGTVGRLLGRHVKNLRSQVARVACLSAGDLFSAQIRGVDQDLDDIAAPLLHRTADTNRFLRADCNSALDRMVEHLPPHKTIAVIVHRGANHQNAIVRAATARLLAQVVDRIGPDHAMILPRDVRDKLFSTGAKLLIDGNLDARNHAKKMFRRLTRCEGFRKALTDSVSEATLRHIDKALKSL